MVETVHRSVLIDGGTICLDNKETKAIGTLLILERGMRILHRHKPM